MPKLSAVIGRNIRVARTRKGWTQDQLAAKLDMQRQTLTQIEKGGRQVTIDDLPLLARVLDLQVRELFVGADRDDLARFD